MKVYRGYNRGGHQASSHLVTVTEDGQERMLEHRVRHSPTGMSWGYSGSGCADLARSLLWDHLGEEPRPAAYQALKFAFVTKWPIEGWELTTDELDQWLDSYRCDPSHFVTVAEYERILFNPPMMLGGEGQ